MLKQNSRTVKMEHKKDREIGGVVQVTSMTIKKRLYYSPKEEKG
jgi:hypothetical protein